LIFKCVNIYNTPFKIAKYKNKAAKCKFKGLKNNTLDKKYSTSRLYTKKKTFRKPFNKNLNGTFNNALLANSNNNYNKDELEIINPQLLIKDIAISPAIFNIKNGNNNYIYKLIKLKLFNEFCYMPSYKY
jgi:hypothetical protein